MQSDAPSSPTHERPVRRRLLVRGAVQGVGFRPFVYREAVRLGLGGSVRNSPSGVTVEVEGAVACIDALIEKIRETPPPHARVTQLAVLSMQQQGERDFSIRESDATGGGGAVILPDLTTCDDCLAEMLDPSDRRFRYPFINCTQCGPRYSIIEGVPYDRSRTSMQGFAMCRDCQAEYDDPRSRRFHAEPNACRVCGPRLSFRDPSGTSLAVDEEALCAAIDALRSGGIIAVKGIGGFHLMTDARRDAAVRRLRNRKRRGEKPFAVMFPDLAGVALSCALTPAAERLLHGPERPIVLLPRNGGPIATSVAPGSVKLGAMLPYAPLHHLIMRELGFPIVATSGNLANDPIVTDEEDALRRLAGIADFFLVHDRPIVRALDDSVAHIVCGEPQLLRRARGYAPAPITAAGIAEGILAHGSHLKATVAVSTSAGVVLSQHLGDLDTAAACEGHRKALADLPELHGVTPRVAVRDLHPDFASSRTAEGANQPVIAVQHHVAHAAACLAEHGMEPPALAIAWDGTGYGPDGAIWGGEFLHLTEGEWRRVAHLLPFRLPGGEAAVREPRRAALGLLHEAFGDSCFDRADLAPVAAFQPAELRVLRQMLGQGVNSPVTTSAGRLFDGVAALCGLRQKNGYEGQAAAELEAAAAAAAGAYEFPVRRGEDDPNCLIADWRPAIRALIVDLTAGIERSLISARFHDGLVAAAVSVARRLAEPRVVLTGGCFQNVRLTEMAAAELTRAGFEPLWHRHAPPNDGGIALGQAVWASWCEPREKRQCA